MKLLIIIVLAIPILYLVRRNLLQVDLSFPLFGALILLGFASMSDPLMHSIASGLDIVYPPIAIVFISIAILLALIIILAILFSRLRYRQLMLLRYMAQLELGRQQLDIARRDKED